ncbi:predicted protein [Candida tropicalis MYA-3404]|uniref:Uncharacterized protein n=1 Tax=Candida tropicalis (strain ATCC MYA-3404 / T1) TaxID=294747 RepID=C5MGX4_CANTT|nr:predicted protein [Candida tropicalis MYA-3404]EER30876.1 predicted protein [Candida tropicalis MYA-3404]KAG4404435.1 hypothetical protein JTP64_006187 [Candida tropicalis]
MSLIRGITLHKTSKLYSNMEVPFSASWISQTKTVFILMIRLRRRENISANSFLYLVSRVLEVANLLAKTSHILRQSSNMSPKSTICATTSFKNPMVIFQTSVTESLSINSKKAIKNSESSRTSTSESIVVLGNSGSDCALHLDKIEVNKEGKVI